VRPDVPNLAGQNTAYVLNQIYKFAEGKRPNAFFMEGFVKAMSNDERFAVAVYYSSQQPASLPMKDAALAGRGKQVYESICKTCHGERGTGNETIARLAGQQPDYLVASIKRYREGARLDPRMLVNVRSLSETDIRAVTAYIGSL
jgi:cytochrome c553